MYSTGLSLTITLQVNSLPSTLAVIIASPGAIAVIKPYASTEAIPSAEEEYSTFEEEYEIEGGKKVIAFGYYGYNG